MDKNRNRYADYSRRFSQTKRDFFGGNFSNNCEGSFNADFSRRHCNEYEQKKPVYQDRIKTAFNNNGSANVNRFSNNNGSFTKRNVANSNYDDEFLNNSGDKFCIDRVGRSVSENLSSSSDLWDVPSFSQKYKFALPETEDMAGLSLPNRSKPRSCCFNCSQDDHKLESCPYPLNHEKVRRNKQQFHAKSAEAVEQQRIHARYHVDGNEVTVPRFAHFKPGKFTDNLRKALELNDDQLPAFIYRMRVLGYPPGWLSEATVLRSQIGIKAEDYEEGEINEDKFEYDFDRIIAYPGFNSPLPENCVDEYDLHGVPRYSVEHNIELFLKSLGSRLEKKSALNRRKDGISKADFVETRVVEMDVADEDDVPPSCQNFNENQSDVAFTSTVTELDNSKQSSSSVSKEWNKQNACSNPQISDLSELSLLTESFLSSSASAHTGSSIQEQDGTPLFLTDDRLDIRTPDQAHFSIGINEHRFFENLPGSVGNFKRLIQIVKKS